MSVFLPQSYGRIYNDRSGWSGVSREKRKLFDDEQLLDLLISFSRLDCAMMIVETLEKLRLLLYPTRRKIRSR